MAYCQKWKLRWRQLRGQLPLLPPLLQPKTSLRTIPLWQAQGLEVRARVCVSVCASVRKAAPAKDVSEDQPLVAGPGLGGACVHVCVCSCASMCNKQVFVFIRELNVTACNDMTMLEWAESMHDRMELQCVVPKWRGLAHMSQSVKSKA